ncbi:MAG: hypothetical protein L0Y71_13050 [Gemmataceae bacterium]|nr:hypothetical protein [Gemmataceae bacterium]
MARRLQELNPLPVRVLDIRGRPRWHEIWKGNPRIAKPDFAGPVQPITSGADRRPYIERQTKRRWIWREWSCPVGEVFLTARERELGARYPGRVIVEPNLKAQACRNKDWGWSRWDALVRQLLRRGFPVAQLGSSATRLLPGVELIRTAGFREAAAVLASARLAILPEGGLHHAAAALGIPAVVIFGGYISPRQTGYAHHVNLYAGGNPCGMRARCRHCVEAMNSIQPEQVLEHVTMQLDGERCQAGVAGEMRMAASG